MRISRMLVAIAAATLSTLATVGTAHADTFTLAGTNTDGPNGYCAFPVTVNYVVNNEYVRPGPHGILVTGTAVATVTNAKTGKSITYNISGPGTVTFYPDGTSIKTENAGGPNLLWTTVANSYPGVPQLAYSTGHVQFTLDPSGKTTSYSLNGTRTDVCAALA